MISDGGPALAAAITAAVASALGETAVVAVYDHVPETAAAPCVWLDAVAGRFDPAQGGWTVDFDATVVADAGLGALDAARQLAAMTDAILLMVAPGVSDRTVTFRGGGLTTRVGEIAHPCTVITVPQLNQVC